MTQTTSFDLMDGNRVVPTEGTLLAAGSSELPGKERWTIYMVIRGAEHGCYWLQRIGRSSVEGETTRYKLTVCHTPEDLIQEMHRTTDGRTYLPNLNRRVLEDVVSVDPAVAQSYRQLVSS